MKEFIMKYMKLFLMCIGMPQITLSMKQRYSKRKHTEISSSIISSKKELEIAFLSSSIQQHGDKKLKELSKKIKHYFDISERMKPLSDKKTIKTLSEHLAACGMMHKQIFLRDSAHISVEKPSVTAQDDIVVLSLNPYENQNFLDFCILHELGHLAKGHLLDKLPNKKHNHDQEFEADAFAQDYFLKQKKYMPIIYDAIDLLKQNPKYLLKDSFTHPCDLERAERDLDALQKGLALEGKTLSDMLQEEESISRLDIILIKKIINQHFGIRYFS